MKKDCMEIPLKDIYQLLIAECRYGYTRNNHLMPSCAYDRVREYLPTMLELDKGFALATARQLCEEAISDELLTHFRDGIDDQHGNMMDTVRFVEFLMSWIDVNSYYSTEFLVYNRTSYHSWYEKAVAHKREEGLKNG